MRAPLPLFVGLGCVMMMSACAVAPPPGPSLLAQPGPNRTEAQFEAQDAHCRDYAAAANGGLTPAQAANRSGIGSAALGTVLGAAAGVVLGAAVGAPGAGAAIGGGTGLLFGSASGTDAAARSGAAYQANYDNAYAQCTRTSGNVIALPPMMGYPPMMMPPPAGAYPPPPPPPAGAYPPPPLPQQPAPPPPIPGYDN